VKWIAGLGNPGGKYEGTRHNVGFMAVDRMAERLGVRWTVNTRCRALVCEGRLANGETVVLLKPQTYMNLSGESIRAYMNYYKLPLEDFIVVYDDMDTEVGQLRLRYKGSAGGHNGIKSIIQHTGTEQFKRIRIGISRPPEGMEIVHYVLSDFTRSERPIIDKVLDLTCDAIEMASGEAFDKVMAKFNAMKA
jgi:PTH1 family peptidyl-tRNA hydrolase